eukprot:2292726-Karenia_brevis.AAC.1
MDIYKGKGDACKAASYRDVTLSNADAKPFMGQVRHDSMQSVATAVSCAQFGGGCNGGSCPVANLLARAQ